MDLLLVVQALFGIVVFVAIAVVFSEQRTLPGWRLLVAGLGLQFLFAFAVFNLNFLQQMLSLINRGVNAVVNATESGTLFIFGYLGGDPLNVDYPFSISEPGATMILAFRILPLVLMFTVLSAILWHYRVLPVIIKGFSLVLRKSLNVSGAVGFSSAANIFIGMVESPALIRPYIAVLTRSELFVVMSCGMATIAGSVMVFYSIILQGTLDDPLGHIITASVISAPAAIMIALIMVPQKTAATSEEIQLSVEYKSLMDAITKGTYDGVRLMVSVGAMLLELAALVALLNSLFSLIKFPGDDPLTLQRLFGYVFAPLTWLMSIPWSEAQISGSRMGTKAALNELLVLLCKRRGFTPRCRARRSVKSAAFSADEVLQ